MRFQVYAKSQGAGWTRDWFWAANVGREHGPYPLRVWAWLAAVAAWVKSGGSI